MRYGLKASNLVTSIPTQPLTSDLQQTNAYIICLPSICVTQSLCLSRLRRRWTLESPESRSANQSSSSLEGPAFFSQGWTRNTHQPSSSSKPLLPTSTVRYFPYVSARLGTQQCVEDLRSYCKTAVSWSADDRPVFHLCEPGLVRLLRNIFWPLVAGADTASSAAGLQAETAARAGCGRGPEEWEGFVTHTHTLC